MKAKSKSHHRFPEYSSLSTGISIGALALGTVIGRITGLDPIEAAPPIDESGPTGHRRSESPAKGPDQSQQSIDESALSRDHRGP